MNDEVVAFEDFIDVVSLSTLHMVQNMAGEIFVPACHILKQAKTCLIASQNI